MIISKDFNSSKYEYRFPKELGIDKSNYIRIPMSLLVDNKLDKNRVSIYAYIAMYRGLNSKVLFSVPKFLEWAGFKSDTRSGGINDKVLDTLNRLSDMGYFVYLDEMTRTSTAEIKVDMQFINEECEDDFAFVYIDEIEKIMKFKKNNPKDAHLNSFSVLLTFAYLRRKIFRRINELKPEERYPEQMAERRERCPEAYASTYQEIGVSVGLSSRTVSKAVKILWELKLIVFEESYHVRLEDGEYRTPYTMFTNYEKREDKYLLDSGIEYAHAEMRNKMKQINKYSKGIYKLKIADAS